MAAEKSGGWSRALLTPTVLIGSLGYFVDVYDLLSFSIVRTASLRSLGVPEARLLEVGVRLLNMQMAGLLLGGVLWGVLGDKRGRRSVLFGSIFLYSVANLANASVRTIPAYAWLRLLAGIGLAGELGSAVTLVVETLPKATRGYGTMVVAAIGLLGGLAAGLAGDLLSWRTVFLLGGIGGLALLGARAGILESGLYRSTADRAVPRGDLMMLLTQPERLKKYLKCVLVGVPVWYVLGILLTFAPEIGRQAGFSGTVLAGRAILWSYVGVPIGDVLAGYLSQRLRSRKKVVFGMLGLLCLFIPPFLLAKGAGPGTIYLLSCLLGFGTGYWALFVTIAAEQFGTNLRATVTTTTPNMVRGSVVLLTSAFRWLGGPLGLAGSAAVVGAAVMAVSALSLAGLKETFGKDLDFIEAP